MSLEHDRRSWLLVDALIALFSLWLASSRHMQFLYAPFDDLLFARLANSIRDGHWLGAYNNLTLAKGPAYPAFLALTSALGLPLRLAEQAVALLGCWLVCGMIANLSGRWWLATIAFAAAALNPAPSGMSLDRVVREDLYLGLVTVVVGLASRAFLARAQACVTVGRLSSSACLGLALAFFWLTREEGFWIAPAVSLLASSWLIRRWIDRPALGRVPYAAATCMLLILPVISFSAVDLGIAAMNRHEYGVFETNDFRSRPFRDAYGALSRIEHDRWQRWIPVPRDARERAYSVSPAARELEPSLDGSNGHNWTKVGCSAVFIVPCDDIQSGWFMWALRDAAANAGHYGNAVDAGHFYARLAAQINQACDQGRIRCLARRSGFLPPLRRAYLPIVARDTWQLMVMLAELGGEAPADGPSDDAPAAIAQFRRVALGPWTRPDRVRRGDRPNDLEVVGWGFATSGRPVVRIVGGSDLENTVLPVQDAPTIPAALGAASGQAVRFNAVVRCGNDPCRIEVDANGHAALHPLMTLLPGAAVNQRTLRLWLDRVEPLHPRWQPARAASTFISATMRTASVVLMPLLVVVLLGLVVLDLRARVLRPLTVLWLALLSVMIARIGLLAVLDATSLPAISPLYLSPATGAAILFTVGILGDGIIRVNSRHRRPPLGLRGRR